MPDTTVVVGMMGMADVTLDSYEGIEAIDLVITYDPVITVQSVASAVPAEFGCVLSSNLDVPGVMVLAFGCTVPLTNEAVTKLATVNFTGINEGSTPLHYQSCSINEGGFVCNKIDGSVLVTPLMACQLPPFEATKLSPYILTGEHPGQPLVDNVATRNETVIGYARSVAWRPILPDLSEASRNLIVQHRSMPHPEGAVVGLSINCDLGQPEQIATQLANLQIAIDAGILRGPADGDLPRDIFLVCPEGVSDGKITWTQLYEIAAVVRGMFATAGLQIPVGILERKHILLAEKEVLCNSEIQGFVAIVNPWEDANGADTPENEAIVLGQAIDQIHTELVMADPPCSNWWFRMVQTSRPVSASDPNFSPEKAGSYIDGARAVQYSSMQHGTSNGIVWAEAVIAVWHQLYHDTLIFSRYTCNYVLLGGCDQIADIVDQPLLAPHFATCEGQGGD